MAMCVYSIELSNYELIKTKKYQFHLAPFHSNGSALAPEFPKYVLLFRPIKCVTIATT